MKYPIYVIQISQGTELMETAELVWLRLKAKEYYHQAIRQYPKSIFRWAYLRKYIKMLFKS